MKIRTLILPAIVMLIVGAMITDEAQAGCTSPVGIRGEIIYNSDYRVMQYCNDAIWVGMTGGGAPLPTCTVGQILVSTGSGWQCANNNCTANSFTFTDQTDVLPNTLITSNAITVSGLNSSELCIVGATNGIAAPEIIKNGINTGASSAIVTNGDTIAVRAKASSAKSGVSNTVVTLGGKTDTFSATTIADFRWVFVTSTTYDANLGGYTGADAKCTTRKTAAGLSGSFEAWVSSGSSSASSRLTHATVPYVLLDGTKVADNWSDLTDNSLDAPISIDEFGASQTGQAHTNVTPGGFISSGSDSWNCTSFTTSSGSWAQFGELASVDDQWTGLSPPSPGCGTMRRLYCFEQ